MLEGTAMTLANDRSIIETLTRGVLVSEHDRDYLGQGIAESTTTRLGGVKCIVKRNGYCSDVRAEVAAYRLSTMFPGLVHVPVTVLRTDPDNRRDMVSVQVWANGTATLRHRNDWSGITRSEIIGLAAFDYIIGNPDRHQNNVLRSGSLLYAIDHGLAFSSNVASIAYSTVRGRAIPSYIRSHMRDRLLSHKATAYRLLSGTVSDDRILRVISRAEDIAIRATF